MLAHKAFLQSKKNERGLNVIELAEVTAFLDMKTKIEDEDSIILGQNIHLKFF